MRFIIIIPTLNESENITLLLPKILTLVNNCHIVVVDDGSQDGTCEAVKSFQNSASIVLQRVHLLERGRKLGYASAIQDGMRYAMSIGADRIIQMDADLSHDPQYLPMMMQQSFDYDLVIGSRYVLGGGTRNWGVSRQLLSKSGNFIARTLLNLPVRDCTGGFRCWNTSLLASSGILSINVEGYAFLFTSLELSHRSGVSIKEIPIVFVDRCFGKSKMSLRIVRESIRTLLNIWLARRLPTPGIRSKHSLTGESTSEDDL